MTHALTLELDRIVGRSPLNVRTDDDLGDIAGLAASIRAIGMLQPIIIRDDGRGWEVLDGSRRHAAWCHLREEGHIRADHAVGIVVDARSEVDAREASLAANVLRRDLHPVEEFEAFARLVHDGFTPERIASDFNVSTRFVRQRLALDRLAPRVREGWRTGRFSADVAIAFTVAPDVAAQEALLDAHQPDHWIWRNAREIRASFIRNAIRADAAEARYVGLDAYHAAGGAIDDNLFEDFSLCLDGSLLNRLARDKMLAEGEALMERHGYGSLTFRGEIENPWTWTALPPEYTPAETGRLEAIQEEEQALGEPADDEDENDDLDAAYARLAEERETIEARARQRSGTAAQRAQACLVLSLTREGELLAEPRIPPKADKAPHAKVNAQVSDLPPDPAPASAKAAPAEEKKPGKALVECLDAARTAALARLVGERPELAMILATAVLTASFTGSPLRVSVTERNTDGAAARGFRDACEQLLGAANHDADVLQTRFAAAVAATIVVRSQGANTYQNTASDTDATATLTDIVAAFAGGDTYPQAMREALDYAAYFKAATRAAAIDAVTIADGDVAHARGLKKVELAAYTAELCRDKGWLPAELRTGDPPKTRRKGADLRSLADAMAAALAADGEPPDTPATADTAAGEPGIYTVAAFLAQVTARALGTDIQVSVLYDLYKARLAGRTPEVDKVQTFSTAVTAAGIAKKRRKDGVYFLDIHVPTDVREAA